jgi:AraC family transcriptional regulator
MEFHKSIETNYRNVKKEVPAFWEKCYQNGTVNKILDIAKKNKTEKLEGAILAAVWHNENNFKYLIGTETTEDEIALETITIPALTWAIFEARGSMPNSVQDLWYRIFSEWFPSSGYEHVKAPGLEVTPLKIALEEEENSEHYCEIWVPVIKK